MSDSNDLKEEINNLLIEAETFYEDNDETNIEEGVLELFGGLIGGVMAALGNAARINSQNREFFDSHRELLEKMTNLIDEMENAGFRKLQTKVSRDELYKKYKKSMLKASFSFTKRSSKKKFILLFGDLMARTLSILAEALVSKLVSMNIDVAKVSAFDELVSIDTGDRKMNYFLRQLDDLYNQVLLLFDKTYEPMVKIINDKKRIIRNSKELKSNFIDNLDKQVNDIIEKKYKLQQNRTTQKIQQT